MMRLDKFLCETGFGTRTEVKKMISKGLVASDGRILKKADEKIDPLKSEITVSGKRAEYTEFEYYMLNKPAGVISASRTDLRNKKEVCVVDLIKTSLRRDLFPVGRLDKDTVGLLLITNDGALSHKLLSPKKHVDKTYYVELESPVSSEDIKKLEEGIDIGDEKPTLPCRISPAPESPDFSKISEESPLSPSRDFSDCKSFFITIHEGRFHQIKRMFEACGSKVTYLKRLRMGSLFLDESLKEGEYRKLSDEEIRRLNS